MPVTEISEVSEFTEITPVPGSPHSIVGVINVRGNIVSIIDLRQRFGLPSLQQTRDTNIIIIEEAGRNSLFGVLVDTVKDVIYLENSRIEAAPNVGNEDSQECITGVCKHGEDMVIILSGGSLKVDQLNAEEI